MTRQRQILVTVIYNDLGCIIDTKAEPYAEQNLQPTCNQLATDCISRQGAIDEAKHYIEIGYDSDIIHTFENLPSAQPEIIRCKDCIHFLTPHGCGYIDGMVTAIDDGFCSYGERRTDGEIH